MAVASGPPMKIGNMRCSPVVSRSNTMGELVGSSTRTPTSSISTIALHPTAVFRTAALGY
jgi:hypothetical protein